MHPPRRFLEALVRTGRVATAAERCGVSPQTAWSHIKRSRAGQIPFLQIEHRGRVLAFHEHVDEIRGLVDETYSPTPSSALQAAWAARAARPAPPPDPPLERRDMAAERIRAAQPVKHPHQVLHKLEEPQQPPPTTNASPLRPWDRLRRPNRSASGPAIVRALRQVACASSTRAIRCAAGAADVDLTMLGASDALERI